MGLRSGIEDKLLDQAGKLLRCFTDMCNCLAPCDARAVPAVGAAGGTHPPRSPTAARHQRSARCEMPTAGMSCPDHCRHRPGSSPLQHTAIQSWRMGSLVKFEKGVWADALNHKHRIRSFRLLMQHGDHGGSRVCKEKRPLSHLEGGLQGA